MLTNWNTDGLVLVVFFTHSLLSTLIDTLCLLCLISWFLCLLSWFLCQMSWLYIYMSNDISMKRYITQMFHHSHVTPLIRYTTHVIHHSHFHYYTTHPFSTFPLSRNTKTICVSFLCCTHQSVHTSSLCIILLCPSTQTHSCEATPGPSLASFTVFVDW